MSGMAYPFDEDLATNSSPVEPTDLGARLAAMEGATVDRGRAVTWHAGRATSISAPSTTRPSPSARYPVTSTRLAEGTDRVYSRL